ncbi:hypothetical protein [Halostella sp. PRR32]|uniref:hypothetical protein n=2 Tax=Halobacteriales TaxID=2235 RepID=UPI002B1D1CE2|nr:hypothetical protein [Halostella sp. PRR32]
MTGYARLPAVDLDGAETVFEPSDGGEGHWVGAPCVHRHDGTTYLAVRWRDPERRGYAVAVYERTAPDEFDERVRLTADALGAVSVERPALVTDPRTDDLHCYLPVEHGENDWTVQKLDAAADPSGFDPGTARDVLVPEPGTTDEETVKDPCIVTLGGRYYMFYAGHDGVSEQAHLATSADGETWTRAETNPVLGRSGWHDHHTRVTAVCPAPDAPVWLVFYDGSATGDYGATWNLRTGVAIARDLRRPVDTTPDEPALSAPVSGGETGLDSFGTCRYVDILDDGDERELFAEVARTDGAFELRRCSLSER